MEDYAKDSGPGAVRASCSFGYDLLGHHFFMSEDMRLKFTSYFLTAFQACFRSFKDISLGIALGVVGAILIGFSHIFCHTDCTISHKSIE